VDPAKWKKRTMLLKDSIKCPFGIEYSITEAASEMHKHCKLRTTKIRAKTNCMHTCGLRPSSHRVALRKSGKLQPNLKLCKRLIDLYWKRPTVDIEIIHALIEDAIPKYQKIDAAFVSNLRRQIMPHVLMPDRKLTAADVEKWGSSHAADEPIPLNNESLHVNFCNFLQQAFSAKKTRWDVHCFMEDCKATVYGFDYWI
jgi:hypothetical protein